MLEYDGCAQAGPRVPLNKRYILGKLTTATLSPSPWCHVIFHLPSAAQRSTAVEWKG